MRVEIYGDAKRKTVSGPTVQFTADDAAPVNDLKAQITPSIAGHSSVTITANGQNTSASLTKPVYGGSVDVTTGVVTETHGGGAYNPTEVPTDLSSKIVSATTVKSASGSVASFNCTLGEYPMSALTAAINPVQDLHGYDHPWPAGGGKNLLDTSASITISRVTISADSSGYVSASPNNSDPRKWDYNSAQWKLTLPAGNYIISYEVKTASTSPSQGIRVIDSNENVLADFINSTAFTQSRNFSFTLANSTNIGVIAKLYDGVARFMICRASESAPTVWSPYSNICPITGWTGVSVYRTGKNLCYHDPNVKSNIYNGGNLIPVKAGDKVYCYGEWTYTQAANLWGGIFASQSETIKNNRKVELGWLISGGVAEYTITVDGYFGVAYSSGVATYTIEKMMISLSPITGATDYEPYQGNTYAIQLGDTVYGGTLDVTTGKLTVDRAMVTLDGTDIVKEGSTWSTWEYVYYKAVTLTGRYATGPTVPNIISNQTYAVSYADLRSANKAGLISLTGKGDYLEWTSSAETLAEEQARLSLLPMQVVYELATPVTYTLTPQDIATILGQNNVWADTGDVTVSYRDGLLSNVSGIMTNSTALTAGENITYTLSQERTFQIPGTVIRTVVGNNVMSASTGNISVTWSFHWFDITPWIAYQGLTFSRNDVDSPDAGRDMSGYMHRGRVGVKEKMNVTTVQLTRAQSSTLQTLLYPETIQVRVTPYPRTNTSHTMSMYTNNVKTTYVIHRENGEDLQSLTFPLIEN